MLSPWIALQAGVLVELLHRALQHVQLVSATCTSVLLPHQPDVQQARGSRVAIQPTAGPGLSPPANSVLFGWADRMQERRRSVAVTSRSLSSP